VYDIETIAERPQSNGTRLYAKDAHSSAYFGYSVALGPTVGDPGNINPTLVVGAYGAMGFGEAYVFSRVPHSREWLEVARLRAPDAEVGDRFGWSVDLYKDILVVGAPLHNTDGAVYVYNLVMKSGDDDEEEDDFVSLNRADMHSDTAWEFSQRLDQSKGDQRHIGTPAASDFFGISVAASSEVVLVGVSGYAQDVETGGVWVFQSNGQRRVLQTQEMTERRADSEMLRAIEDGHGNQYFERKMFEERDSAEKEEKYRHKQRDLSHSHAQYRNTRSLNDDNNKSNKSNKKQDLEAEEESDGVFALTQVITPPNIREAVRFGWSMAYDPVKQRVLIGTEMTKVKGAGAAYMFRYKDTSSSFIFESVHTPEPDSGSIMFGFSCSLHGDHALIGATKGTGATELSGVAYYYKAQTRQEWNLLTASVVQEDPPGRELAMSIGIAVPILLAVILSILFYSCGERPSTAGYSQSLSNVEMIEIDDRDKSGFTRMVTGMFQKKKRDTAIDVSSRPVGMDVRDFTVDEDIVNE